MVPARARGAAPKTEAATAKDSSAAPSSPEAPSRYQSTKARTPACTIWPTQDRSSALRSRNHGISDSMRAIADVLSAPLDRTSAAAARCRDGTVREAMEGG